MNKVAVITRTKDRPVFLKRAIESVLNQTFTDYVHVIVNDGGDRSVVEEVVSSFADNGKIKLFHRDTPSNAPDTIFNESIDRVESKYFAIHDDDDTWHSDFLTKTVEYMESNQSLGAVVARTNKVFEELNDDRIVQVKVTGWMDDLKVISLYRQCIDNQFTPIATLFRRDAYETVGKFDQSLPVVGDWEFGIRLLMRYDAGFINPGYALANYHHRKQVGSGQDHISTHEKHRHYTNLIMNKYLRSELAEGRLGVGYIMSQLKYNQSFISMSLKKLLPANLVEKLKARISR